MNERPVVEILYIEGCPNHEAAQELVERVVTQAGVEADVRRVEVRDDRDAVAKRFLGSPTIRVNGRDVEPGASERSGYARACRVYRTERGPAARPDEGWVRAALTGSFGPVDTAAS